MKSPKNRHLRDVEEVQLIGLIFKPDKQAFAAVGIIELAFEVTAEGNHAVGGQAIPIEIAAGEFAVVFLGAFLAG